MDSTTTGPMNLDWNQQLLVNINQGLASSWGDWFFPWVSETTTFSFPLMALLLMWLSWRYRPLGWKIALLVLLAVISADIMGNFLKSLFAHPRPCQTMAELLRHVNGTTFDACSGSTTGMPSNHALNFFTLASLLLVWLRIHWLSVSMLIIACFVACSRIYLGKHFPSQVVAGGLLGLGYGTLFAYLCLRYIHPVNQLFRPRSL